MNALNTFDYSSSIEPWLTVPDSRKAVDFYVAAFGATEVYRMQGEEEDLVLKLSINGAGFWISNGAVPADSSIGGNIRMILTVDDPDSLYSRAMNAGAIQIYPVGNEHGWRLGRICDPFGFHWEIGHPLKT
jgi:PhnB protein